MAMEYSVMQEKKGLQPTLREIKEAVEERSTAWMNGVRAMLRSSSEEVIWETTQVDFRDGESSTTAAMVNRERPKNRASDKQMNYLISLQKATSLTNFSAEAIRSMSSKQVGALIDKNIQFRNELPCPSWLFRQLRQKFGVPASRIPLTWGGAFQARKDLENGMPVDKLPISTQVRLFG
jgi:hypothetical protein